MTDLTTRKTITAVQHDDHISIKVISSWGDIAIIEDQLEDELQLEITAFKPIKDGDGKEIGCELIYPNVHLVKDVQNAIDNIIWPSACKYVS